MELQHQVLGVLAALCFIVAMVFFAYGLGQLVEDMAEDTEGWPVRDGHRPWWHWRVVNAKLAWHLLSILPGWMRYRWDTWGDTQVQVNRWFTKWLWRNILDEWRQL